MKSKIHEYLLKLNNKGMSKTIKKQTVLKMACVAFAFASSVTYA